ncbi:MAG TPA: DUF2795 domain-containing protein [Planctomycetota bacterium]|nr:DUF2795 domain-containing protein [Planctomycetota bacterium]
MAAAKVSSSPSCTIVKALHGLDFPAAKQELTQCAEMQGLIPEVMELLEQIPDREYVNLADVFKAIGQVEE